MAARNVRRNARRSFITVLVVLTTSSAILFGRALLDGVFDSVIQSVTQSLTGDVQVHEATYMVARDALVLDRTLEWPGDLEAQLRAEPEVVEVAGRILFAGMLTDSEQENTTPVFGLALDPAHEPAITPNNFTRVTDGLALSMDDPDGIVIGQALATSLGLHVGDEVTLLLNTQGGSLNGADLTVRGVANVQLPGPASKMVQICLPTAQRLLRMPNQVTEVALKLESARQPDVERFEARLKTKLKAISPDLDSNTWMDVSRAYLDTFALWETAFNVFVGIFYLMMVSGIINTLLMSVLERVVEIGVLMALGVRRRRILMLFLLESLVLAAYGSAAGVLVGGGLVLYFHEKGLYLPTAGSLPKFVYPTLDLGYTLWIVGVVHVVSAVAALITVYRISKMTPVEALSHG